MSSSQRRSPYVSFNYACNLHCDYCFSSGFDKKYKEKMMSTKDFSALVEWLVKQDINSIGLFGGEPTLHPKFNDFIDHVRGRISVFVPTNGLFTDKKRKAFKGGAIKGAILHLNPKKTYSKKQWTLLNENTSFLNSLGLLVSGIRIIVSSSPIDQEEVLSFCQLHGIGCLDVAFARPGAFGGNAFLSLARTQEYLPAIEKNILFFRKNGLSAFIASNLPYCFAEKYLYLFNSSIEKASPQGVCYLTDGEFDASVIIQPDLTTNVCMGLPFLNSKRIIEYRTFDEVKDVFKKDFEALREKPIFPKCIKCKHFNRDCYGGCLSYKLL